MKYILVSARYKYNKRNEIEAYVLENYLHEIAKRGYVPIMLSHANLTNELLDNASAYLLTAPTGLPVGAVRLKQIPILYQLILE